MSMVEDVRQIFQDFLAPELRALATQVKANSEISEAQGKSLQGQLESQGKSLQSQLETQGKLIHTQIEALTQRMEYLHRESMLRSDTLEQRLTSRLDQIVQSFELEKRLARLEAREIAS
jgi:DNA-binding transcriptional regulator GbsR (MarR family)